MVSISEASVDPLVILKKCFCSGLHMTLECRNTKLLTHLWVHHNVCHCPQGEAEPTMKRICTDHHQSIICLPVCLSPCLPVGDVQASERTVHSDVPEESLSTLVHRGGHGRNGIHRGREQHERSCIGVPAIPGCVR